MKKILFASLISSLFIAFGLLSFNTQAAGNLTITTSSLPEATVGQTYAVQLEVTGGVAPYTWRTISPTTYPNTCCVMAVTTTGMFGATSAGPASKVPEPSGTYSWTFEVEDALGVKASKTFSITIHPECRTTAFFATSNTVDLGQGATLNWSTVNCNKVELYGTNAAGNAFTSALSSYASGSYSISPFATPGDYYYRIAGTASGVVDPVADVLDTVKITVVENDPAAISVIPVKISLPDVIIGSNYNGYVEFYSSAENPPLIVNLPSGLVPEFTVLGPSIAGDHVRVSLSGVPAESNTVGRQYFQILFSQGTSAQETKNYYLDIYDNTLPSVGSVSAGKNVVYNGTVYYISPAGTNRKPYTSAGAFLSYGFNSWSSVLPATSADLSLPLATYTPLDTMITVPSYVYPRNGSLINDKGTVYLITEGMRAGFSSAQLFLSLGYSFDNVMAGDTSFLPTLAPINSDQIPHPSGTVVNQNGTLYLMRTGKKLGIPNMAVFNSWGLKLNEVVKANSFDIVSPQDAVLQMRAEYQFGI